MIDKSILLIPADKGGCGFYRIMQPGLRYAELTGYKVCVQQAGESYHSIPQLHSGMMNHGLDTVIMHRPMEDHQVAHWRSVKRALPNLKIFMDFDDLLWHPCPRSAYKPTPKMISNLDECAGFADRLIASTRPMADALWHRYKKKATVLPNMIADSEFRDVRVNDRPRMKILWAGSATHQSDMDQIIPVVKETHSKYDWSFMGYVPPEISKIVDVIPSVARDDFLNTIYDVSPDVGIAPLIRTPFNKCKSNIKLLEYGAIGTATIASAVYPYNHSAASLVSPGRTSEWLSALERLEDTQARRANATASQNYARQFSLSSGDDAILKAYN